MTRQQRKAKRGPERPFPFFAAFLASVALHALLLLVSPLFGVALRSAPPPRPEESVLHFSFAPTEDATEEEARPEGMVPFEVPQARSVPAAEPPPGGRPSLQPPSPPQAARDPSRPEPEQQEADPSRTETAQERKAEERERSRTTEPFPADADAAYRAEEPEDAASKRPARGDSIDVARALRDWGRAVARARAASPPGSAGGGEGRNVFVPDPANLPPTGFGVGNLTFESRDYDWTDYARQIYWEILRAWYNRLYDTTDEFEKWMHLTGNPFLNHQVLVRFVIERDGDVTGIQVEVVSGCPPLDDSARTALDEVILSPLPADFPRDREVVRGLFIARGPIPSMRPMLSQLKAAGQF